MTDRDKFLTSGGGTDPV